MPPTSLTPSTSGGVEVYDFEAAYIKEYGSEANERRLKRIAQAHEVRNPLRRLFDLLREVAQEEVSFDFDPSQLTASDVSTWVDLERLHDLGKTIEDLLFSIRYVSTFQVHADEPDPAYRNSPENPMEILSMDYSALMCLKPPQFEAIYSKVVYLRALDGRNFRLSLGQTSDPVDPQFCAAIEEVRHPSVLVAVRRLVGLIFRSILSINEQGV